MPTTNPLLSWLLMGTVLLGAWWGCYRLALRSERGFGYNRAFLVTGPLLAVALPLLPLVWPAAWSWGPDGDWLAKLLGPWTAAAPARPLAAASVLLPAVRAGGAAGAAGGGWAFWPTALYLGGVALGLGRLGFDLGRLWLMARALPREPHPGYTLRRTGGRLPTSSFGRVVFWDETQPLAPAEARQVLAHELAHIHQNHTLDRLLLAALRAVLWPNPFVHLSARALALTHEFLADAAALQAEAGRAVAPATPPRVAAYAHLLARQVATHLGFSAPLAHAFSPSHTLTRITMLHQTHPVRRWKQWLALPLLALLLGTVAHSQTVAPPKFPAPPAPPALPALPAPPAPPALPAPPPPPVVYESVEQMPELPGGGGPEAIVAFVQAHLAYPKLAPAEQRDGQLFISFIVAEDGTVQAVKIIKSLAPAYDKAALAAVRQLPRFRPGRKTFPARQGGPRAVAVSYTVPVQFARQAK